MVDYTAVCILLTRVWSFLNWILFFVCLFFRGNILYNLKKKMEKRNSAQSPFPGIRHQTTYFTIPIYWSILTSWVTKYHYANDQTSDRKDNQLEFSIFQKQECFQVPRGCGTWKHSKHLRWIINWGSNNMSIKKRCEGIIPLTNEPSVNWGEGHKKQMLFFYYL